MIIANENTKYQLKQITTEIIYILNTELKQRTHYENDRISISHIPIINIFRGQRIGINNIGNGVVEISRIKVLNLTHCSHFFMKVTLLYLLFGSQYYNIYQNL